MARRVAGEESLGLSGGRPANQAVDTDAGLVTRARNGDGAAFEQLYLRHRDHMYTLCLNLCGDREQAQDLLQDAFLRAYRALPGFRGGSQFTTWLYRIVLNLCRDAARRRRRSPDPVSALPSTDPATVTTISQARQALRLLGPRHRAVLALRYSQSLSYREIAELLGWSLPRVKVTLHRARRAFKEAYLGLDEGLP
jgi:RNA polymerase sigma-70 factor (ECF subfamily)